MSVIGGKCKKVISILRGGRVRLPNRVLPIRVTLCDDNDTTVTEGKRGTQGQRIRLITGYIHELLNNSIELGTFTIYPSG